VVTLVFSIRVHYKIYAPCALSVIPGAALHGHLIQESSKVLVLNMVIFIKWKNADIDSVYFEGRQQT